MNNYLIIGLGSMGKRRIRCLKRLGISSDSIWGYDIRYDRRMEAKDRYGINIVSSLDEMDYKMLRCIIVSLPPDRHYFGVEVAYKYKIPVFIEASVVLDDALQIMTSMPDGLFVAPSCTFIFHPIVKQIMDIVQSKKYGKVCNFSHHYGQYLPDWHSWENVNDYYVSRRISGAARESLTYELTWIVRLFGIPNEIKGFFRKTAELGCDIEDTYVGALSYENCLGSLMVDVVARTATRNLVINFEKAQVQWRVDKARLEIFEVDTGKWLIIEEEDRIEEEGYSSNVGENMYIDELKVFLDSLENPSSYPNTMEEDIKILQLLKQLEDSDGGYYRDYISKAD